MTNIKSLLFSFALLCILTSCSNSTTTHNEKTTLMVSAAVSLTDALEEIKVLYEEDHPVELIFNLGGSGSLSQQIQQGAPVDVFISANEDWMDKLSTDDLIIESTREDITGNGLVLIASKDSTMAYQSITDIHADDIEQIAIGNPESVPAGKYTEQVLQNLNLWHDLETKLVLGKDVRQVLTYVETGNVDIGFVYESDALTSDQINILAAAEAGTHEAVVYPVAILKDTKQEKEASDFITFLTSDKAQAIFEKHGFTK